MNYSPSRNISDEEALSTYRFLQNNPVFFIEEVLGAKLWSKQIEIVEKLFKHKRCTVKSCHSIGKSFISSRIAIAFHSTWVNSITITTAPTDRQVKGIIWREIHKAVNNSKCDLGLNPNMQTSSISEEWIALGFTAPPRDDSRFQGFHENRMLVIADEACGISREIFVGIESILTTEHCYLLMIGNPTDENTYFGESFKDEDFSKVTISAFDTPNFTTFGITEQDFIDDTWRDKIEGREMPCPYLITPDWAYRRFRKWGIGDPLYESRIKACFPSSDDSALVSLTDIETAYQNELIPTAGEPVFVAVDIAGMGRDRTVFMARRGNMIWCCKSYSQKNTMETVGEIIGLIRQGLTDPRGQHAKVKPENITVDIGGLGVGVYDRLREQNCNVQGFSFGARAKELSRSKKRIVEREFINLRAQVYYLVREAFKNREIWIADKSEELLELTKIKWRSRSDGVIQIESKEEIKKRLKRSPDFADALVMLYCPRAVTWDEFDPSIYDASTDEDED